MPYVDTGKVNLFYETVGTGDPPVLLIHELGGSSESWRGVTPLIAARRRTLAVDLRNAGRSEKPPGPVELADFADDLADLAGVLGIGQVDVVGAALGSVLGIVLAIQHPALVRRMVLCATAEAISDNARRYIAERAERVRSVGMRGVAAASLANAFPDEHATARAGQLPIYLANDPAAYAETSLALTRMAITAEHWCRVTIPVLVASGEHDFIWPPDAGRAVADRIAGARFRLLENAGHFPHLQVPAMVAEMALDFFA